MSYANKTQMFEKIKIRHQISARHAKKRSNIKSQFSISVQNKFEMLQEVTSAEEKLNLLRESIEKSLHDPVPVKTRKEHKKWMTQEILELMDERRMLKSNSTLYQELNKVIRKKYNEAKEMWLSKKCSQIEANSLKNCTKKMHDEIRELSGKRKSSPQGRCIRAVDGSMLTDRNDILNRWAEYIEELFQDDREDKPEIDKPMEGLKIMIDEVRAAMKKTKYGKTAGSDSITIETLDALANWGIDFITTLLNQIYDSGEIPKEMCKSIFIMLPKKDVATEGGMHRTIGLMSHLTKLLLRILMERMRSKLKPEISNSQFGFMADKGKRNAIFTLSMMIERAIEMKKDLYLCFIDYAKAFDRVKHNELFGILSGLDIDGKDLRIIRNLYLDQTAATRLDGVVSQFKPIKRGVRQGCVLSPDLFNIYGERILYNIRDQDGCNIGGMNINNLRYADDMVLIAEAERAPSFGGLLEKQLLLKNYPP